MVDDAIKLTLPGMQKKNKSLRSGVLWIVCGLLLVGAAGGGVWWWQSQIFDKLARVESAITPLVSPADGRVAHVATLNDTVQLGQVVVQLDNAPFVAQLEEARARLEAVTPGRESSGSVRTAEERLQVAVEQARQHEQQARRDVEQYSNSHAQALLAMRRPDMQRAGAQRLNTAQLAEIEARTNLETAKRVFGTQSRARTVAEADLLRFRKDLQAVAQMSQNPEVLARVQEVMARRVREAEAALGATVVLSPQEGRVTRLAVAPGALVQAGQLVAEVTPARVRILARVSAADAARIRVGQNVRVRYVGIAEQPFAAGTVHAVLPADAEGRVAVRVEAEAPAVGGVPAQDTVVEVKFLNFFL